MERNRCWAGLAIVFLFVFVWCAATFHWRYIIALIAGGAILHAANLVYFRLAEKLPAGNEVLRSRDAIWKRTVGTDFTSLPSDSGSGIDLNSEYLVQVQWLIDHIHMALDRQIVKACGLLAFNALVMALLAIEMSRLTAPIMWDDSLSDIARLGMIGVLGGLAASSIACLNIFSVHWATPEEYGSYRGEVAFDVKMLARRTRSLALSVFISGVSLLMAMALIALTELFVRPMPAG